MGAVDIFCAKYSVFTVYLLTTLAGILLFTIGIVYFFVFNHHVNFVAQQIWSFSFLLMIIGGLLFLLALLGSCGAISRSPCLLFFPTVIFTAFFIIQFGVGIYGAVKQDDANDAWDQIFNETFKNYEANKEVWDFMQTGLQCCGIVGPNDWTNGTHNNLPDSCCIKLEQGETCSFQNASKIGCKAAFFDFLKSHSLFVACLLIGISLIQILLISWSCFLYGILRKQKLYTELEPTYYY